MLQKIGTLLKRLYALLSLLMPTLYPTSTDGVERLAEAIIAVYGVSDPSFILIARRRIAESVLRGANSHILVLRLKFYNEIRMALSAGAGFAALEAIKKDERERQEATAASETVVQETQS